nr:MAG TPA: hypothetical protein [Caudoviricetes sp.]
MINFLHRNITSPVDLICLNIISQHMQWLRDCHQ